MPRRVREHVRATSDASTAAPLSRERWRKRVRGGERKRERERGGERERERESEGEGEAEGIGRGRRMPQRSSRGRISEKLIERVIANTFHQLSPSRAIMLSLILPLNTFINSSALLSLLV